MKPNMKIFDSMKSHILKMAVVAAGISLLSACADDKYTELDKGYDELALVSSVEEAVLQETDHSSEAITLEWTTGHNYGTGNKIFYTLEIDMKGNGFANPYIAVDNEKRVYSWTKSVEELNDIVRGRFTEEAGKPGEARSCSLEARITATVPGCEETQQSVIAFDVTTYVPVTKTLYIIGTAAPNGWSADNAAEMSRTSNGVFTWTGNMKEGEFKFITTLGEFIPAYCKGTDGKLVYRGSDDEPDEKFVIDEGYTYRIDANLLTGDISINKSDAETPAYDELFLVGNMTDWGFEPMSRDILDPFLFRMSRVFDKGGEFKFGTSEGSWENMYKATSENAPYTQTSMEFISGFDPDNKWNLKDEETGKAYKICVDIRKNRERMMMREFVPYDCIWLVGEAAPGGWDLSNADPMTVDPSDPYVLTWEGQLGTGELKFTCDKKSDWNGAWFMAAEGGAAPSGEEERMLFVDKSDDEFKAQYIDMQLGDIDQKWVIQTAGTYRITLNQLKETVTIAKK